MTFPPTAFCEGSIGPPVFACEHRRIGTIPLRQIWSRRPEESVMAETHGAERGLSRFEGFTDAVFAIALTLLIVEIKPPGSPEGPQPDAGLFHTIFGQWREFLTL